MDICEISQKNLTDQEKLERILNRCKEVLIKRPEPHPITWFDLSSLIERDAHNHRLMGAQSVAEYVFRICGEEMPRPAVEEIRG
jgi:hypothetical protein